MNTKVFRGLNMTYSEFGNGSKNLLVLPGVAIRNVTDVEELVKKQYEMLLDEYTVYLVDRCNNVPEGYSIEAMADDTYSLMKELGVELIDVYGNSQGSMIAMFLAIKYPEMVDKLVLGSTTSRMTASEFETLNTWGRMASENRIEELVRYQMDYLYESEAIKSTVDSAVEYNLAASQEEIDRFPILIDSMRNFDVYDRLKDIKAKTFVIAAKGDRVFNYQASVDIANALNCDLYLYDESFGHCVCDEAPDYVERVYKFLTGDK